eukprot:gene16836-18534_t
MALDSKRPKQVKKAFNICVLGLSGIDQDRTLYGVGKSCLCNRFVRPAQDDYCDNHSSVYSPSDFSGSVINNDHFLFWGSVSKIVEDSEMIFNVVEQTEFFDDSSYTSFSIGGKLTPYSKRCTNTKLHSAGKLKYISRDQVALQGDYEQIRMPEQDGKFTIDGFICVYDVSSNIAEESDKITQQEELLSTALSSINKAKKPVVVVATKCDESVETLLSQAQKFVHSKKLAVPLIETSAVGDINITLGFAVLGQMVESKGKFRSKIYHFQEALSLHQEIVQKSFDKYQILVRGVVTDLRSLQKWREFKVKYESNEDLKDYVFIAGSKQAERVFNKQVLKIRQHYKEKKLNEYLSKLPDALDELLPTLKLIESYEWKWDSCQQAIKCHKSFDKQFKILPEDVIWDDIEELLNESDDRIPFDVLHLDRSRACFDRHVKKLVESGRKVRMKSEFRKLLELTAKIRPGTSWSDAYLWLSNEESYKSLDEHERKEIFEKYLQEITLAAKLDFQELLFESAPKFMKLDPNCRPSEADMKELDVYLQEDERYKRLEFVDNARDILLFNHIALMQSSTRCLSGPETCMDRLMQGVVEMTAHRPAYNPYENDLLMDGDDDEQIGIVVFGTNGLASELEKKIKLQSSSSDSLEYIVDGQIFALDLKVIGDDVNNDPNDFINSVLDFRPQGSLAIFSCENSLNYLKEVLKVLKDADEGQQENFLNLPFILVMARESGREEDVNFLMQEGQELADQLQCLFVDYPYTLSTLDGRIHETQVQDAIRGIVDVIKKRLRPQCTPSFLPEKTPDLRILLCAMCGDQYPVELILGPLLHHQSLLCNSSAKPDTVILETYVGTDKRVVSITLSSYHRAHSLKNELFHGFILVYSATRIASFETLSAFANTVPQVPIQVLAVTGSASGASVVFHNEKASTLLAGGTSLANKLSAKFQTTSPLFQHQTGAFAAFFTSAYHKKDETEFLIAGIKGRPLPEVPKPHNSTLKPMANGNSQKESDYAEIPARSNALVTTSLEVKSEISEDSVPSSPTREYRTDSFKDRRSRSSTQDSRELFDPDDLFEVPHDETGLYAQVLKDFKKRKLAAEKESSEGDEESEVQWCDNVAYGSNSDLKLGPNHNRQYNTAPHASKSQKIPVSDRKYATLNTVATKASRYIYPDSRATNLTPKDQLPVDVGYEPGDSLSSLSSQSKDSLGSQGGDEPYLASVQRKIDYFRSLNSTKDPYPPSPHWRHDPRSRADSDQKAPLAKQEDDQEPVDNSIEKVREELQIKLSIHGQDDGGRVDLQSNKDSQEPEKQLEISRSSDSSDTVSRSRSGSKHETLSQQFKKIMRKMSPAPSPANSESDLNKLSTSNTLKKKFKGRKKPNRKKDRDISPSSNDIGAAVSPQPPSEDSSILDTSLEKSASLPMRKSNSKKGEFNSLERKSNRKFGTRKSNKNPPSIVIDDTGEVQHNTGTFKKDKHKKRQSRDDFELDVDQNEVPSDDEKGSPKRKPRKARSLRFISRGDKDKLKQDKTRKEWERKKKKQREKPSYNYFGKSLQDVCENETLLPRFFANCIDHIEAVGMETEGIYRVSGNKQDIDYLLTQFENDKNLNLQELSISIHSFTGALKQFFTLLPDPLVPVNCYDQILDNMIIMNADERLSKLKALIQGFPKQNLAVFKKLMIHLKRVTDHKLHNKMDVRNLGICLFPTVMRPDFTNIATISQNMNMGLFIQTCIEQCDGLFDLEEDDS